MPFSNKAKMYMRRVDLVLDTPSNEPLLHAHGRFFRYYVSTIYRIMNHQQDMTWYPGKLIGLMARALEVRLKEQL
jgi:hypothetical protein